MTKNRWYALMGKLSIREGLSTFNMLVTAYTAKQRHYHTERHIDDCLAKLDATKDLARDPAEIEIALWFHDFIYDPHKSDNEERSAVAACEFLASYAVAPDRLSRVRQHILATRHEAIAIDADSRLLVDIDLSILGADETEYATFETNVREEYYWVPALIFKKKRAEILQSFLDRPRVYSTDYFYDRLESSARQNLRHAIEALLA